MNLIQDLKAEFQKKDNALTKIILVNVVVFVILGIISVICHLTSNTIVFDKIYEQFILPTSLSELIYRPWTLITYFFAHSNGDILHILFNMLALYWFGKLINEYIGGRRLLNLYILGGIVSALFYLLIFNGVNKFINIPYSPGLVGASGAVFAVMVGAATLLPTYSFQLLLIGSVRIGYIAAFYIFISFLGTTGSNAGGNIAHLGGALFGYIFIRQLQRGNDLGKPITKISEWVTGLFTRKKELKVTYRKKGNSPDANYEPDQKEIDAILDKISRSGYESLTKEEKQKLFKASQK